MEKIKLSLPAMAEYTTTLRLFASGVATRLGLDVERMEDIKLVVSEMMIMSIKDEMDLFEMSIKVEEDALVIKAAVSKDAKDDMSIKIMEALADEIDINGESIRLKFIKEK